MNVHVPGRGGAVSAGRSTSAERSAPADVLFVEAAMGFGGSTVALGRLLAALDCREFRAHVATARAAQRDHLVRVGLPAADVVVLPECPARAARRPSGRLASALHALTRPIRGAMDWVSRTEPAARAIEHLARERGASLLHLNNSVCVNLPGVLAARRLGVPCIVKQRGFPWPSPEVRWAARHVAAFLPSSDCVAQSLVAIGVPPSRIRVNYSPLGADGLAPGGARAEFRASLGLPPGVPVFGMVACLHRWKGQHVFVEASADVLRHVPDAIALVVGGPPSPAAVPYARQLAARVEELGLRDRVRFTGHRDDVPRVLAALDVCVHASIEAEPFGLSVIEAMAMARPVVAAAAGGPLEYVSHGVTGLLSPPGDHRALAEAIVTLLRDADLARRLGDAARRSVCDRFGAAEHARVTAEVYRAALAGAAPVSA